MKILICVLIGYLLGAINPAAFISRIKRKDIRSGGTGNLGATNVGIHFGKKLGILVMVFDLAKAFAAVKLAELIFPELAFAGPVSGCAAVAGHIFPFYLKFKGGKGLASYGGLVLALSPSIFALLLTIGVFCLVISNYCLGLVIEAAVLFPILIGLKFESVSVFIISAVISALLLWQFRGNLERIRRGEEIKIRDSLKKLLPVNKTK